MYRATIPNRVFTIGITIVLLAGASVFGDRRDQDDRKDRSSQSSRSSGGSGDSSSRTTSSGQSSSNSGAAIRSFSSRSDQSSQGQTVDRSSRSFSDSVRGSSFSGRVLDGRSSDNGSSAIRSFGGQTVARPIDGTLSNSDGGNATRTWRGDSRLGRQADGSQLRSQDSATRLTNDKVRDFLQLRRDDPANAAGTTGKQNLAGKFGRNSIEATVGANASNSVGQLKWRDQYKDSQIQGDQAWARRFGTPSTNAGSGKSAGDVNKLRDGKSNRQLGNSTFKNEPKLDRASIDRSYSDWRKTNLGGGHSGAADHRDWSGRWKDGERLAAADDIRGSWKNHHGGKDIPFANDWWRSHDNHPGHWNDWDHFGGHHHSRYYWWDWCDGPRLSTWLTFGWGTPCYWDYGPGEYIYCNNGVVYVNGVWFEPAPVFYERTLLVAQRAPHWTLQQAAQVEWLPLGVFVVARDGVADNNVLVQLAVTQDGVIGGTIFNQLTGASFPIEGSVDKDTQRAVWTYNDDTGARIIMESSIFNLTQPAATGLIHYGPDNIQVVELVRLEQPNAGQ